MIAPDLPSIRRSGEFRLNQKKWRILWQNFANIAKYVIFAEKERHGLQHRHISKDAGSRKNTV